MANLRLGVSGRDIVDDDGVDKALANGLDNGLDNGLGA
jgi:hypothetical protein